MVKGVFKAKKLGGLLVDAGLITGDQLRQALDLQKAKGGRLGDLLLDLRFLSRESLLAFLGDKCGVSTVSLSEYGAVPADVLALLPEPIARRSRMIPLRREGDTLTVAMADPLDVFLTDDLRLLTGCRIHAVVASEEEIRSAIEARYGEVCNVPSVDGQIRFAPAGEEGPSLGDPDGRAANLLNVLLENAARAGASAVHLEPGENSIKVRYRIGGKLLPRPEISGRFQEGLAVRVKTLARMNPFETVAPQEGHIRAKVSGREMDIRVSTLPTFFGEKIALRFTDGVLPELYLQKLGFEAEDEARLRDVLAAPGGLVLIVGGVGSGKTTTFYASLLHVFRPDRHVAAMEDPVERCLPGVIQIQARPHAGLTVASGIRSLLRQDADLIGVGDIRSDEDVGAVLEAVQAGVPVIATLRAAGWAAAVERFRRAGASSRELAAAVKAVVVQRRVRTLCRTCRESYNLSNENPLLGIPAELTAGSGPASFFRARGCGDCGGTGRRGEILLASVLVADEEFRTDLLAGPGFDGDGLRTAALRKALDGTISLDDALL
jgi:type IV pilus assembly protein PilB